MKFSVKRKDIAGGLLEIERSALSGRVKVTQNGKALERLKEKHSPFEILMKDGSKRRLHFKSRWLDPVPALDLEGEEIRLAEPLRIIDYLFACFPVLMFLAYGILPTLVAFFLLLANFRILRTRRSATLKWASIYACNIFVFWLVLNLVAFVSKNAGK